ncbi:MAG: mandelate racemase/muconate lactonizing enzyme family protein [Pirellula sp.]
MKLTYRGFEVHKRVALAISRGTQSSSQNLEIRILKDGVEGIGEAAEFSIPHTAQSFGFLEQELARAESILRAFDPWQREQIHTALTEHRIASSAIAGIDMAVWDWCGKVAGQPVWRLLGLSQLSKVPSSVTIGIQSPESAQQRWAQWLELGVIRAVKVKMGSPAGIRADQAMFEALAKLLPDQIHRSVDANGGWSVADAIEMSRWLAQRGVDHIEQPTDPGNLEALAQVHRESSLPIMADESCRTSKDIPGLVSCCSGINIKILKCGGLTEAMRMIHTARAHNLKLMLGCYSQTSLGNTAAHQLASLVDYVDLDSHLNLKDDPFVGCRFDDGFLVNRELPGLGVTHA